MRPASPDRRPDRALLGLTLALVVTLHGCATPEPPRDPARANDLVLSALHYVDVDYKWGGNTPDEGFDCSGFTRHVYLDRLGVTLPRRSEEQARAADLHDVAHRALAAGDLVFFNTLGRRHSHVGIYVGDGRFVHAPRTGARVRVESMQSPYWASRFDGARRHAAL